MPQLDFSETKRQWHLLRLAFLGGHAEEAEKAVGRTLAPLVTKLDTKESIMWSVVGVVGVSAMIMILVFIDSFITDQDKYQTVLTSAGRSRVEYNTLINDDMSTATREILP
jgi:nitric oxide reductase large subunit